MMIAYLMVTWKLKSRSGAEGGNSKETEAGPLDAATPATLADKGGESNLRSLHQARTPGGNIFAFNRGPEGVSTGTSGHCLVTQHTQGLCSPEVLSRAPRWPLECAPQHTGSTPRV